MPYLHHSREYLRLIVGLHESLRCGAHDLMILGHHVVSIDTDMRHRGRLRPVAGVVFTTVAVVQSATETKLKRCTC